MNKADINEFASSQPQKVKEWLVMIDKFMLDGRCRIDSKVVSNSKRIDGRFSYTSKKTKKTVCIIIIGSSGCKISLRGNHFIHPNSKGNILDELPADMFSVVKKRKSCGCRNSDHSINYNYDCVHGVCGLYIYKKKTFVTCLYSGFDFALDDTTNFDMLTKWIVLESSFGGEIKQLQEPKHNRKC
jgi:hypothetical protein